MAAERFTKERASSLVLDHNFYPREGLDWSNIGRLRIALQIGHTLPPVIADRNTRRVVDGFHRIMATLKQFGDLADIQVEWRDYPNAAMFLADAIRLNSGHGVRFTDGDVGRCCRLAEKFQMEPNVLAAALVMKPETIAEMRGPRRVSTEQRMRTRRVSRFDREFTERPVDQISLSEMAAHILRAIEDEAIDKGDTALREQLRQLMLACERALGRDSMAAGCIEKACPFPVVKNGRCAQHQWFKAVELTRHRGPSVVMG